MVHHPRARSALCVSLLAIATLARLSAAPAARADVMRMPWGMTSLELVSVGDPGNPARSTPYPHGSVGYKYQIGKYEVTIAQYAEFLNAVAAASDPYGLYNPNMATDTTMAGIVRSGMPGRYTYQVIGSPNRPITYVSWGDAARFANWLTNGQPHGPPGPQTTESGSYDLFGANTDAELLAVERRPDAVFVLPTQDEWYKAGHYDPTRRGEPYWLYPMRTDERPTAAVPPGLTAPNPAHAANFEFEQFSNGGTTPVGSYPMATSYYGTYDQGGNVYEWNETRMGVFRGERGGAWSSDYYFLREPDVGLPPTCDSWVVGFRIARVPEPSSGLLLLAIGGTGLITCRRRGRRPDPPARAAP